MHRIAVYINSNQCSLLYNQGTILTKKPMIVMIVALGTNLLLLVVYDLGSEVVKFNCFHFLSMRLLCADMTALGLKVNKKACIK